jgi:hypothetical protein
MKDYFSHDYNARNDKEMVKVLMKLNLTGVGLFWCIIEMLYEENGFLLLSECERIAFELRTENEIIKSLINDFILFKNDGIKFWSESVLRRIEIRNNKSITARESAKKRWIEYNGNANALHSHSKGNAIKESKLKEK